MARARRRSKARKTKARRKTRRSAGKTWTADSVKTLRKMYRTSTNRVIGRKLRRSVASVAAKARSLRLRKPKRRKAAASSRRRRRR